MYGSFGPLWYRGFIYGIDGRYDSLSTQGVDSVLQYCNVDEIIVGHSEQDTISTFHDGKIIAIDVDVEALGGQRALLWENGTFYRVHNSGEQISLKP